MGIISIFSSTFISIVLCWTIATQTMVSVGVMKDFIPYLKESEPSASFNETYVTSVDEASLSNYQKKMYKKDASRLALRHIAKGSDFDELGAEMPKEVVDELYTSLLAIHASPYNEAQVVTKQHKLHTFPIPAVDMFQVHYKKGAKWSTPLRLGDYSTDSQIIEEICAQYGLKIQSHQTWNEDTNMFIVKAKTPVNLAAIAQLFLKEDGIKDVHLPKPNIDGNDIEASKTVNGWKLSYVIKFESCLTGCQKRHTWDFEVANIKGNNANVNFIGESGDELPAWMQ